MLDAIFVPFIIAFDVPLEGFALFIGWSSHAAALSNERASGSQSRTTNVYRRELATDTLATC